MNDNGRTPMALDPADQQRRGDRFADLHQGPTFVVANPWDAGSARILAGLGFPALATTSGGLAITLGRPDGANLVTRDEALANVAVIAAATDLPVSADLENGYGVDPADAADTIRLAAAAGAVGGSIEDATGHPDAPIHDLGLAVERVAAAVEAARSLPFRFTLTARAENYLHGRPDLDDTIRRLQSFEAAGADVLYAPGLPDADSIRTVCAAVSRPVNALPAPGLSVADLSTLGVRRISVGSSLARAAVTGFLDAAREITTSGTFTYTRTATPFTTLKDWLRNT